MKINISEIINLQKKLDENINKKHNINFEKELNKRKLALLVEICEMINVNRCFKFWSSNNSYDKNKLGDEFVDCLHFILSLSIHYNMSKMEFEIPINTYDNYELTDKVLKLIESGLNIKNAIDCEIFIFNLFDLSYTFGFKAVDIIDFYKKKNEINFKRQKDNY